MNQTLICPAENMKGIEKPEADRARGRIPFAAKVCFTAFMAVLVPIYFRDYGPTNFLYFCDVALFLTLIGLWAENALLLSMASVGILIPQFLWLADFLAHLGGFKLVGMTDYMFESSRPLFTRGLSLFHGWLPLLLVWVLKRTGYDKRALPAWTATAFVLVTVAYLFLPPAGAKLPNPNTPVNINYVYGLSDAEPQHWMNPNLYVCVWMAALVSLVYVPTHFVLRKLYRPAASSPVETMVTAGN